MADSLKEFSSHTGKKYSDLKNPGVTLATTTGSQKAVIKTVSLTNDNLRNITLKEGSIDGPTVAQGSTTGFSGNEILDNSQTLIATTSQKLVSTGVHRVGWGEGNKDTTGDSTATVRVYGAGGVLFEGEDFTADWGPTTPATQYSSRYWNTAVASQSITRCSDSWWGADGRFYFIKRVKDYGDFVVRRYETNSTSTTTYGSSMDHTLAVWDGERYFYTFKDGENFFRKYDTSTLGTSNTYTSVTMKTDGSDSTNQTVSLERGAAGSYYMDGHVLITGGTNNANASLRLVSLTTGKTRKVYGYQTNWSWHGGTYYISGVDNNRTSIGLVKNTAGEYWAFQGHFGSSSWTNEYNVIYLSNLGKSLEAYVSNSGSATVNKKWCVRAGYSGANDLDIDSTDKARNLIRHLAVDGRRFGNPAGVVMHSPGVPRYAYLVGDKWNQTSGVDNSSGAAMQILDFDNALNATTFYDASITQAGTGDGEYRYVAGTYRAVQEPSAADGNFGNIDLRTSGILIT